MRPLYILAAAVLVLLLIGQVRVGGRAEFNRSGFFLWVRLGRFSIRLLPAKAKQERIKKEKKPKKPKKKRRASGEAEPAGKPRQEQPPAPVTEKIGGTLEYARALLPTALKAAKGILRGLRVDILELELTAGAPDPADAAMVYGGANAALGALWVPLTRAFRVKDGTARVKLDFDAPGTTVYGTAALSIKIGTAVRIGLWAGGRALIELLAARRRLKIRKQQRKAA